MLNNPFRTALTRDEIIGVLLGWIKGPDIALVPEETHLSADEQDLIESHAYNISEDHDNRKDDAWEAYSICRESGQSRDVCRQSVEDFTLEDERFRRLCYEVDDEISKGANSMLRIDLRYSTLTQACYTRTSFDQWWQKTPEISALSRTISKPVSTRKKTKFDLQAESILSHIKGLGHNPKCLESVKPGRSGIKADVRALVQIGKVPFINDKAFDNAWARLRRERKIANPK